MLRLRPFGNCKLGVECKEIMELAEQWENPEPQKTLVNGEKIITTKSILICKRGEMEIKAVTSGQDGVAAGIFAKEYALRQEIEEKYPGLIALLEEPYESLYLNEGMYQTTLQFLKDCIERHDGEIQLAVLYSGSGLEETLIRKVLGRLLPGCEESKPENYLGVLEEYGVATNMYDVPGWDPHLLNDQMMEMLKVSCAETAERIETSGFSHFPEEHREFMGWAGDTAMGMGYGLVLYYSMTEVQPKKRNTWLNKKISELKNALKKAFGGEGARTTKGYSNFADGMSPEDAARYIANNEKAFFNEFSERARAAGLNSTQIEEAFAAI